MPMSSMPTLEYLWSIQIGDGINKMVTHVDMSRKLDALSAGATTEFRVGWGAREAHEKYLATHPQIGNRWGANFHCYFLTNID